MDYSLVSDRADTSHHLQEDAICWANMQSAGTSYYTGIFFVLYCISKAPQAIWASAANEESKGLLNDPNINSALRFTLSQGYGLRGYFKQETENST